jgi:hypothetical protein
MCEVERADGYKARAVSLTLGSDDDAHETRLPIGRMPRQPPQPRATWLVS